MCVAKNLLYTTSHQLPQTEVQNSLALGKKGMVFPAGNLSIIVHCFGISGEHFCVWITLFFVYFFSNIVTGTVNFLTSLLFSVNFSYLNPWSLPFLPPIQGVCVGVLFSGSTKLGNTILNHGSILCTKICKAARPASSLLTLYNPNSHHLGFQNKKCVQFWSLRKLSFSPPHLLTHLPYIFP